MSTLVPCLWRLRLLCCFPVCCLDCSGFGAGTCVSHDFSYIPQLSLLSTILSDTQSFATLFRLIWAMAFMSVPDWACIRTRFAYSLQSCIRVLHLSWSALRVRDDGDITSLCDGQPDSAPLVEDAALLQCMLLTSLSQGG